MTRQPAFSSSASPDPRPLDVLIVGAGISGIGMAAHLARTLPDKRFAILEARESIGGTWDLFRFPGVRSDSDMHTLGYGFAPWTGARTIASGEEILAYLAGVVADHALAERIETGVKVLAADWDEAAHLWRVIARQGGEERRFAARFLFLGAGYFDHERPADPEIAELDTFAGPVLHPQFWPEDASLAGRRVAVIGSGSTAATIVPALAGRGAKVTMIQRTPSWYLAVPSRDALARALARVLPARWVHRAMRWRNARIEHWFFRRARSRPGEIGDWLAAQARDALGPTWDEAAFTPPYGPWRQRLCFVPDGDFFAAFRDRGARIVTGTIAQVDPGGVVMTDGRRVDVDAIVTATGLRIATLGGIVLSIGGVPVDPARHWYYRDCMLSGVPNLAVLFGYLNTGWTLRVDLVAERLCRLFAQMDAWGASRVAPRLPDPPPVPVDPLAGFTSGYLVRGQPLMPKSAASGPWRLSQDYLADRAAAREEPIDDGHLAFARLPARSCMAREVASERHLS